jgi:hypothetical protein
MTMPAGAPESIFESIKTEDDLKQWVRERKSEDLHLEFKQKADSRTGAVDDTDAEGFSQALSSFANADGGVLVFGVETKKVHEVDRAVKLKPFAEAQRFRARLLDSVSTTTQPVVPGVRIEVIEGADGGYVKCLMPASDLTPHRAMRCGGKYWRRTSVGNLEMEHYELADAFGRRLRPVLRVGIKLVPIEDPNPQEKLVFTLLNEGRGAGKARWIRLRSGRGQGRQYNRRRATERIRNQ